MLRRATSMPKAAALTHGNILYQVEAFPTYYLVDPEGTIVFSGIPDRDPEATDHLDALLADIYSE